MRNCEPPAKAGTDPLVQELKRALRTRDVLARLPIGRTKLYDEIKAKRFPKPSKAGRMSLWTPQQVDDYVRKLMGGA